MAVGAVAVRAMAVEVCVAFLPTSSGCGRSETGVPLPRKASGSVYSLPQPRQTAIPLLVATHLCIETARRQELTSGSEGIQANSFWHGCYRTQQRCAQCVGNQEKKKGIRLEALVTEGFLEALAWNWVLEVNRL